MPQKLYMLDGVLRFELTGMVTGQDLQDAITAAAKIERQFAPVPHRITDLSTAVGLNLSFAEVWAVATHRKELKFPNSFRSAIVAPTPVQVGFARMFQTLNDNPQITIRIFPDVNSALAWLAEK